MPTEIIPRLWIGNMNDALNYGLLKNLNVKTVVNCTKDIQFINNDLTNIRVPVDDNLEPQEIENMYKLMNRAVDLIHLSLMSGETVLVHCHAGRQRSAAIIAAYLMKYGGISPVDAIRFIRSKRNIAFFPQVNFKNAIIKYANDLNNLHNIK